MYEIEDKMMLLGFTYACKNYHMRIPNKGNVWKSMTEHDSENNDILCDMIPFNSFRLLESEKVLPHSTEISCWDDVLEDIVGGLHYPDCRISLESDGKDGLKIMVRFDEDGIEYYQLIYCYPEEIERTFVELKAVESPIGIMVDFCGNGFEPKNAIPCDGNHEPYKFARLTMDGERIMDRHYWETSESAEEDAMRCWNDLTTDEAGHLTVKAVSIEDDFPGSEYISHELLVLPNDLP